MVSTMKKQISLIALISVMSSVFQPAWSMEEMDTTEGNSYSKKRKEPEESTNPQLQQRENGRFPKKERTEGGVSILSSAEKLGSIKEEERTEDVTNNNLPAVIQVMEGEQLKVIITRLAPISDTIQSLNIPSEILSYLGIPELSQKLTLLRQMGEEKVVRYFETLPIELIAKIINEYFSPRDALCFGLTCQSHLDFVYTHRPIYRDLDLFLSRKGFFEGTDTLDSTQKIRKFYLARQGNPETEKLDPDAHLSRDKAKLLMSKFFMLREDVRHYPLKHQIITPDRSELLPLCLSNVRRNYYITNYDTLPYNNLAENEIKNINSPHAKVFIYKHFIGPKEKIDERSSQRPRTKAQEEVILLVNKITFQDNPRLFYEVARAIFRKTQVNLSRYIFRQLTYFLKMSPEEKNNHFKPFEQIKIAYMLKLGEKRISDVEWSEFDPSYVTNLKKVNPEDSSHRRLKSLLLAARFASFFHWRANSDGFWLNYLSEIDESGKDLPLWVPVYIYLYQYYSNYESSPEMTCNLLIPGMPSSLDSPFFSFYEDLAVEAYYQNEKIRQKYSSILTSIGANNLGFRKEKGMGTKIDLLKAFALYQQAAENGNKFAMCNLAYCYEKGIGTDPNSGEGQRWIRKVDPKTRERWKKARWSSKS